jgi:RNA polymerase sigma-70 factor (ECF subfamily)
MSREPFERAFAALFADRSAALYRYLSRLSGDTALAEDIVQESFVKLYQRGTMPDDPPAWLVSVAHNLWRDDRRRAVRRQRLLVERSTELPTDDTAPAADAATLAAERIHGVRSALERLSLRERQILLLRHEGYRYREIAAALDVAPSGVGTMLARAIAAFRKAYHEPADASS